jgi:hypothetical protein
LKVKYIIKEILEYSIPIYIKEYYKRNSSTGYYKRQSPYWQSIQVKLGGKKT